MRIKSPEDVGLVTTKKYVYPQSTVNRLDRNLGNLNKKINIIPLIMEEKIVNIPAGLGPVLICNYLNYDKINIMCEKIPFFPRCL